MKKFEIWKSATRYFEEGRKLSAADRLHCSTLHHRYETQKEARRVWRTMRRQGILCTIRKRGES